MLELYGWAVVRVLTSLTVQTMMGMDMELMQQVGSAYCNLVIHSICAFLGTVVGNVYGLAKKATAIAVRVLNDNGAGTFAYVFFVKLQQISTLCLNCRDVVAGVDYAANDHVEKKKPSVAKYVRTLL